MAPYKRLFRSRTDSMIAGVCGGLGNYFDVDPVLIRLGVAVGCILTAVLPGALAYLAACLIVPLEPVPARVPHEAS